MSLRPTQEEERVAASGADGSMRVWDLEATTQIGRLIEVTHPGSRSWSADGRFLATHHVGDDGIGRVEVWNLDTDSLPELGCQIAGRNLSEEEWTEFGPRTIERRATCPEYAL